jgi:hypothetical protein
MAIEALPTPPNRNMSPVQFIAAADAFLAALPLFQEQANAAAVAMNLNSTTGTSSTSNAIGTGAKTFTAETGKSWQPGMFIVIADASAPSTNSMTAQVTSYNSGTGELVVDVKGTLGSGTKSAWAISQTMNPIPLAGSVTHTSLDKSVITGQAEETAPAIDYQLLLSDASESSGALNKISLANLMKVINALTQDTSPDPGADFVMTYDSSASSVKKVLARSLGKVLTSTVTLSGTAPDLATNIPSWVSKITIGIADWSTIGTSNIILQIGDSGGPETSGYLGAAGVNGTYANFTAGFGIAGATAAVSITHGVAILVRVDAASNKWAFSFSGGRSDSAAVLTGGGSKSLSDVLTQIRATTVGGTDTFDGGTAILMLE